MRTIRRACSIPHGWDGTGGCLVHPPLLLATAIAGRDKVKQGIGWLLPDSIGAPTPCRLFLLVVGEEVTTGHLLGRLAGLALGPHVERVPLAHPTHLGTFVGRCHHPGHQ